MLKNLIKTALRNLYKDFGYSSLNILGLTIGITSALFLIIYVSDEISYDRYNEKADRIYRVSSHITEPDDQFTWIFAQIPFGPQVVQDYPEVQSFVRFITFPRSLFKFEDKEFWEENFCYVDSTVFDIFTYKVIRGNPKSALLEPNKIILTEKTANKYFGKTDPIGKSIVTGDKAYEVTAVIKDIPTNSHFRFDGLASRKNLPKQLGNWGNFGVFTYLLFPENFDIKSFEKKMQEMYGKYMAPIFEKINIKIEYKLEPLTKIHLYSTNASEPEPTGSISYVFIFSIVALFLILIAAMNYMNLATARSAKRAREVGLRKVVGSRRSTLIFQFLAESTLFTIISLIISVLLLALLLPKFNEFAGKSFDLQIIFSPVVLLSLVGVILVVGIFGGSYPAFYLSKFSPATVFKGEITQGSAGSLFRKILVVIQFTISVAMIVCTLVVFKQLNFMKTKDQGFDQRNVIGFQMNRSMIQKLSVLKQSLLENPNILSVGTASNPVGEGSGKVIFKMETDQGMIDRGVNFTVVDHDFIKTLGIKIIKGRGFQEDMPSDTLTGVVINETLAKRMNWAEPIGKKVELGNNIKGGVIGVIKDYHQTGMYNQIESLLLVYRLKNNIVYVKLSDKDVQGSLRFIESKWKEVFPEKPFEYKFLTERFNEQFKTDEKRGLIFTLFTILAILIACLGLFGLASYMVEQRTKEIGIRKVVGASEGIIVRMISKEFLLLVSISILIAFPIAFYMMSSWLQNYVYRTELGVMVFIIAALITIAITFITISFKAYKASVLNPASSLRTE